MTLHLVSSNENIIPSNYEKLEKSIHANVAGLIYAIKTNQRKVAFLCLRNAFMNPTWISLFLSGLAWNASKNRDIKKSRRHSYLISSITLGLIGTISYMKDTQEYWGDDLISTVDEAKDYIEWLKNRG